MRRQEGFWYSEHEPHFPKPVPYVLTEAQAELIAAAIKKRERRAALIRYRGMAKSRIDNTFVGSGTYRTDMWEWPQGFAEHYVQKYRVKPTDKFLKYIGVDYGTIEHQASGD